MSESRNYVSRFLWTITLATRHAAVGTVAWEAQLAKDGRLSRRPEGGPFAAVTVPEQVEFAIASLPLLLPFIVLTSSILATVGMLIVHRAQLRRTLRSLLPALFLGSLCGGVALTGLTMGALYMMVGSFVACFALPATTHMYKTWWCRLIELAIAFCSGLLWYGF